MLFLALPPTVRFLICAQIVPCFRERHRMSKAKRLSQHTEMTRQLKSAGECVGIHLLDHIIFNRDSYFSFLEAGIL
jgi:hypothetical protein